jgi:hypothetical protein
MKKASDAGACLRYGHSMLDICVFLSPVKDLNKVVN